MYELESWKEALEAYRTVIERWPEDYRTLIQAGNAARRLQLWEDSQGYFVRASEVRPDAWVPAYNLACLAAVRDQPDRAMDWLEVAIARGFGGVDLMAGDPDFDSIRDRRDFKKHLDRLRVR